MPPTGEGSEANPLLEPRLIQKLKDRKRLVNLGVREEVLEYMEEGLKQRRDPERVAEKASSEAFNLAKGAGEPVLRDRAKKGLDMANEGPFSRL